jgi:hypothetical protein
MPVCLEEQLLNYSQVCCVLVVSFTWKRNLRVQLDTRGVDSCSLVFLTAPLRHTQCGHTSTYEGHGHRPSTK